MSAQIPLPDPDKPFDFEWEATIAAVNEACAGANVECCWNNLCEDCRTLQKLIKVRLIRAFLAGKREGARG